MRLRYWVLVCGIAACLLLPSSPTEAAVSCRCSDGSTQFALSCGACEQACNDRGALLLRCHPKKKKKVSSDGSETIAQPQPRTADEAATSEAAPAVDEPPMEEVGRPIRKGVSCTCQDGSVFTGRFCGECEEKCAELGLLTIRCRPGGPTPVE